MRTWGDIRRPPQGGLPAGRRGESAAQRHRTRTGVPRGWRLGSKRRMSASKVSRSSENFSDQIGPEQTQVWVLGPGLRDHKIQLRDQAQNTTTSQKSECHQRAPDGGKSWPPKKKASISPRPKAKKTPENQRLKTASRRPQPRNHKPGPNEKGRGASHETGPSLVGGGGSVGQLGSVLNTHLPRDTTDQDRDQRSDKDSVHRQQPARQGNGQVDQGAAREEFR